MFTNAQDFRTRFGPLRAETRQFQPRRASAQHLHRPTAQHMPKLFSQLQTQHLFVSITQSVYTQQAKRIQEIPPAQATSA